MPSQTLKIHLVKLATFLHVKIMRSKKSASVFLCRRLSHGDNLPSNCGMFGPHSAGAWDV